MSLDLIFFLYQLPKSGKKKKANFFLTYLTKDIFPFPFHAKKVAFKWPQIVPRYTRTFKNLFLTNLYLFLTNVLIVTVTMMRDKVLAFHQKQKSPFTLFTLQNRRLYI